MEQKVITKDGIEVTIHMSSKGCPPHFKGMSTNMSSSWTVLNGKWYRVDYLANSRSLHNLREYIKKITHEEFVSTVLSNGNEPWSDEIVEWKPDPTLQVRWREAMNKVKEGK